MYMHKQAADQADCTSNFLQDLMACSLRRLRSIAFCIAALAPLPPPAGKASFKAPTSSSSSRSSGSGGWFAPSSSDPKSARLASRMSLSSSPLSLSWSVSAVSGSVVSESAASLSVGAESACACPSDAAGAESSGFLRLPRGPRSFFCV